MRVLAPLPCLREAVEGLHQWEARLRSAQQVEVLGHGTLDQPIYFILNGQSLSTALDAWSSSTLPVPLPSDLQTQCR